MKTKETTNNVNDSMFQIKMFKEEENKGKLVTAVNKWLRKNSKNILDVANVEYIQTERGSYGTSYKYSASVLVQVRKVNWIKDKLGDLLENVNIDELD